MNIPVTKIAENISDQGWQMLELVEKNPEISFKTIRTKTALSQEKAYKILSFLEGGVLITVKKLEDARSIGYVLTEYGEYALKLKKSNS